MLLGYFLITVATVCAQFQIKSWTTDDGLPQNTVYSIVQTRDGYLWLATLDGLVRYDGVTFTVFNKNNTPGITSNRLTRLLEDAAGDLWILTEESGIIRYHDGVFHTFPVVKDASSKPLSKIALNSSGRIVGLIETGLVEFNGENFVPIEPIADETPNSQIFWNRAGAFFCINKQILTRFENGQISHFRLPAEAEEKFKNPFFEDRRGAIWIGTRKAGLLKLENDRLTALTEKDGLPGGNITPKMEDRQENLWAITDKGAVIVSPAGRVTRLTTENGLSDNILAAIYQDREDNIWLGTFYHGLNRANRTAVSFFTTDDGLAANIVHPIFEDKSGDVWLGGGGLTRFHDRRFSRASNETKSFTKVATAIAQDRSGRLWFGFWSGAFYLENGVFVNFTEKFGMMPTVYDIHEDQSDAIWFASNMGLFRCKDDVVTHLTTADGLVSDNAKVIHESADGTLWFGTYGGLSRYKNGRFENFSTADGLSGSQIRAIYEDSDAAIWIGTYDSGLTRFKDGKFIVYTSKDGLFNDGVFCILEDVAGSFWMNSNRGIYRVSKQQLNDFADGRIKHIESIAYGKADGLLETEGNGGQQPAGIKARDGKLWFPTQNGVAVIDPENIRTNPIAPPVVIESVKVDNETVSFGDSLTVAPGKNNLEINYAGLSFVKPEFVKFRYKLEGLDNEWIEAGNRRTAYYSYLPPGVYTFRVIAANSDGVWNMEGAGVKVIVVPPFYRTWWFWILSAFLLTGAAYAFYRRRIVNLEKKQTAQHFFSQQLIESQERERQRIAGELHDGLSQNLVIIKNRAMMTLTERGNDEYVFEQIEEIVEAAGESLAEVRVIANNLRPFQIDRLGLTKAIEALVRKANSPNLRVTAQLDNIDGTFSPAQEINLYRITQESLNNIIKHSAATEATISIKKTGGQIEVVISDNGRGFDVNARLHNESANGTGFGITGIYERARMFGAVPHIESSANGTILRLKISGVFV